jgi:cytochrome d ubiquinol oxidase subunit I
MVAAVGVAAEGDAVLELNQEATRVGFVALQAGWIVTEAGRQPWIIQGIMRTRDAVTPAMGVQGTFALFTLLYLALGVVVAVMIRDLTRAAPPEAT